MIDSDFSKDATYNRVYQEIHRRSEAQEKAIQYNFVSLSVFFGWFFTYGYPRDPTIFAVAAIVNFLFGLKWLSEDNNIARLHQYLEEHKAPLETWQKAKFYDLYPAIVRLQDAAWRITAFVVPGLAMLGLLIGSWTREPHQFTYRAAISGVIATAFMILAANGFFNLWEPWKRMFFFSASR